MFIWHVICFNSILKYFLEKNARKTLKLEINNSILLFHTPGTFVEPLGKVLHVSKSGRLIIKAYTKPPPVNTIVFDENLDEIGFVYDVMGPVSSPYISVQVEKSKIKLENLVGRVVFIKLKKFKRRRRTHGR